MMIAIKILLNQMVSDRPMLMKHLELRRPNSSTNNNGNLDSKLNDVNNSILQLKDLIDQAQKYLHNFQNNINVTMNPEPTDLNLDVANYLNNQDNSQNHPWKKGTTRIIGNSILSGLSSECLNKNNKSPNIPWCNH